MSETCENCGTKITSPGMLSDGNPRYPEETIARFNAATGQSIVELCRRCGPDVITAARMELTVELEKYQGIVDANVQVFPMTTTDHLPAAARWLVRGLVTANVAVGTGIFNELSQGLTDLLGATTTTSGMALKVNKGEAAARAILYRKALAMDANFVIGVDLDYGNTVNNAATVNMQGTAIWVENLEAVLAPEQIEDVNAFLQFHKDAVRLTEKLTSLPNA
ncbi:MAG: heavy metal-binding domain-containing protein [Novosphingobium sp.]|nr:heavy metal-binding domain-containing protein [Novosphingobium sp.]